MGSLIDLESLLNKAEKSNEKWELGNKVLYDLFKNYPKHDNDQSILAKVWLLGRAYAAAIERRRNKKETNEVFYLEKVTKTFKSKELDLDNKISNLKNKTEDILKLHNDLVNAIFILTENNKVSFASKYLHFHKPDYFFIYDSRAKKGISKIINYYDIPKSKKTIKQIDIYNDDYRKFFNNCNRIKEYIKNELKIEMTPRELDSLLLEISKSEYDI